LGVEFARTAYFMPFGSRPYLTDGSAGMSVIGRPHPSTCVFDALAGCAGAAFIGAVNDDASNSKAMIERMKNPTPRP
jgi:hypothetical protein